MLKLDGGGFTTLSRGAVCPSALGNMCPADSNGDAALAYSISYILTERMSWLSKKSIENVLNLSCLKDLRWQPKGPDNSPLEDERQEL